MRIGTWNLEGRWDARHLSLIEDMDCDVLLLTEVSERIDLPGYEVHPGQHLMTKRRWQRSPHAADCGHSGSARSVCHGGG